MIRTRAIRMAVLAVCVLGVAGMIVTSATDHNGAAITFGLVTAVAILCQMVATTVANEARVTAAGTARDAGVPGSAEAEAQALEVQIGDLVAAGADEPAVRDLVRQAVRMGRRGVSEPDR